MLGRSDELVDWWGEGRLHVDVALWMPCREARSRGNGGS